MEAKRSKTHAISHPRHHNLAAQHRGAGGDASKSQIIKNPSEVSLTPSQAAEQAKLNTRKNPLDALSKTNVRQTTMERRSGLQEVDEEYLKQNVIRKPIFPRHSGLIDNHESQHQQKQIPSLAAGQPSIPQTESHQMNITQSQTQCQTQNQQKYQQSVPPQQLPPSTTNQIPTNLQLTSGQMPMPLAGAGMPSQRQGNHPINNLSQQMSQQQQQQAMTPQHYQQPPMQQQQQVPTQQHLSQQNQVSNQQMSNAASALPEPEMCTTCPNCQTTIYLVRGTDVGHEMMSPLPTGQHQQMSYEAASASGNPSPRTTAAAGAN